MLVDRIIGALTFRTGVYSEVKEDATFTRTAWIIVAVVAFLNQLGWQATSNPTSWVLGAILGGVFAIIGFAAAALVMNSVGRALFGSDVTFEELVRTLGLAYVWQVVSVLGALTGLFGALLCLFAPIIVISAILLVVAWFVAANEALDLEWVRTVVTVILGWLAFVVIMLVSRLVLDSLGWGAIAPVGELFGF